MRFHTSIIVASFFLCGCASCQRHPTKSMVYSGETRLGPGDCIIVDSAHRTGAPLRYVIDSAGDISAPYLGKVRVAGLTVSEAARHLEKQYVGREYFSQIDLVVLRCP
jgi:protein involved in polysaccharide export with SLBB domain